MNKKKLIKKTEIVTLGIIAFVAVSFFFNAWADLTRDKISIGTNARSPNVAGYEPDVPAGTSPLSAVSGYESDIQAGTSPLTADVSTTWIEDEKYVFLNSGNGTIKINSSAPIYAINDYPHVYREYSGDNVVVWKHTDFLNMTYLVIWRTGDPLPTKVSPQLGDLFRKMDKILGFSGDDTLLLRSVRSQGPDKVHFYDLDNHTIVGEIEDGQYLGLGYSVDLGMDPALIAKPDNTNGILFRGERSLSMNETQQGLVFQEYDNGSPTVTLFLDEIPLSSTTEQYVSVDATANRYCAVKERIGDISKLGYGYLNETSINYDIVYPGHILAKMHDDKIVYVHKLIDSPIPRPHDAVYLFDMDDGFNMQFVYFSSSTFENIDIYARGPGARIVSEVRDPEARSDIYLYTINNEPPISYIDEATPSSGRVPLTVNFRGRGEDNDGFVDRYVWNFGDGTQSFQQNTTHTYDEDGEYTVYFWAGDSDYVFGNPAHTNITVTQCSDEDNDGYLDKVCGGDDCDDGNDAIHPGATDTPGDGIDSNCNGFDCFIATASYGSCKAKEVNTLRAFRDQHLEKNALGRTFIELYYRYSPPTAEFISDKPALRAVVRFLLKPLVWASEKVTK